MPWSRKLYEPIVLKDAFMINRFEVTIGVLYIALGAISPWLLYQSPPLAALQTIALIGLGLLKVYRGLGEQQSRG